MEVMQNLKKGCLHCEAFVIWGWLHNLRMYCHVDESTSDRWPRSHAMCFLMQRWLACMQCAPFPHRKKTVVASQFAMGSSLLSQSPCMMEQSGMGTYVASPSFYPSFHRYHSPLIMHDEDSFPFLLSRSLALSCIFIYFFFSFDATVLLGPGGPSRTFRPARPSTCPGRTQPSL